MNNAIRRAHQLLDNIHAIPGYTGNEGKIVITIDQMQGGARRIEIAFITAEVAELNGDSLQKISKKNFIIANSATLACNNRQI